MATSASTKIAGDKAALLKDLELALFAGKIAAYAQGFAVMSGASKEFNWNLPMPTIAKIWRAGCIIRSQMLDTMAEAFGTGGASTNLLMAPAFIAMMQEAHPSLRRVVARASEAGAPVPALSSALAYFDSYRQGRGTSNLIQAQRDFFGAHGFERIDGAGALPWPVGQRRGWLERSSVKADLSRIVPDLALIGDNLARLASLQGAGGGAADPAEHGGRARCRPGGSLR